MENEYQPMEYFEFNQRSRIITEPTYTNPQEEVTDFFGSFSAEGLVKIREEDKIDLDKWEKRLKNATKNLPTEEKHETISRFQRIKSAYKLNDHPNS